MPEKKKGILVKLSKFDKEKWRKYVKETDNFDNVSQLIRNIINSYIKGNLIEKKSIVQKVVKKSSDIDGFIDLWNEFKEFKKTQEKQNKNIEKLAIYIENGHKSFPPNTFEIEEEIIRLVEICPLTSDQLSEMLKIPELRILKFLNQMTGHHTIGLNKKMEYVLVESEKQNKELNFNVEE